MANELDYGVLAPLMDDDDVMDISVNRYDQVFVWHRWEGRQAADVQFADEAAAYDLAQRLAAAAQVPLNTEHPIAEVRLPNGGRAVLMVSPVATYGTMIQIAKPHRSSMTMERIIEVGSITQEAADFLKACVQGRLNVAVVGGYSSGKTTILNILANAIPLEERVLIVQPIETITIPHANQVALESRKGGLDGNGAVTNGHLLQAADLLQADRTVLAELDGTEVAVLLEVLHIGHSALFGMSGTGARDALAQLETYATSSNLAQPLLSIRQKIARSLDVIVHIELTQYDGRRRVMDITQVGGLQGDDIALDSIFTRTEGTGWELVPTGVVPHFRDRLQAKGIDLPKTMFQGRGQPGTFPEGSSGLA